MSSHINKIEYPYAAKWDKSKQYATFTLSNTHYSLANSIRRSMISYVPTAAFKAQPYEHCTIDIKRNDSKLNNEIIKQRLSLIPINIPFPEDFDIEDYIFILDIENDTHNILTVTTEHFTMKRISTNKYLSKSEVQQFLPADPITKEFIPIVRLLPKHYTALNHTPEVSRAIMDAIKIPVANTIGIKLEAKLVISNGLDNAGFSAVSLASYGNTIDTEKAKVAEDAYVDSIHSIEKGQEITLSDEQTLRRRFKINEIQRNFVTDEYDEPTSFDFTVRSVGVIPPLVIFERGCQKLIEELNTLITNIDTKNVNEVTIEPNPTMGDNSYNIHVLNADDTLGNIVQNYCSMLFADYNLEPEQRKCSAITYHKVHPLKREIMITVRPISGSADNYENANDIVVTGCKYIIKQLMEIIKDLQKHKEYVSEYKSISK
jgi:DNA-directed RNA polymerase alpha subunit/DNA-directed RNA polymerase subunit L